MSLQAPSRPVPPRGPRASGRPGVAGRSGVAGVLVALTVGAAIAVAVVLLGLPASPSAAAPAAGPAPLSTRGVVVATAACTDPAARDVVEFRGADGRPQKLPLDACGTQAGTIVPLTVTPGDPMAHLAGTGGRAGSAAERSPTAGRLAVTLGAVAVLGAAALLVALWHQRRRPRAGGGTPGSAGSPPRRPA